MVQKSLILTVLGGLSLLGGIILLSLAADTFSIQTMIEKGARFKTVHTLS